MKQTPFTLWRPEKLRAASGHFFLAAFFFLPGSKPLMYVALALAILLFIGGGGVGNALKLRLAPPWTTPALILCALPLLSPLIHDQPAKNLEHLSLAYYWLVAFMVYFASGQMAAVGWLRAYLGGLALVLAYLQLWQAGALDLGTPPSAFSNTIMYSQFLALGIGLLAVLYRHDGQGRPVKLLYLAGMALFFAALAGNIGRTGMLSILLLLPFIFHQLFGPGNRAKVFAACLVAGALLASSPTVQHRTDAAFDDLRRLEQNESRTSLGYRVEMWRTGWEIFRAHPLLGAGYSAFNAEWNKSPRDEGAQGFVEPHNAFVFFAAAYGVPGLAALVWLYAVLLRDGWRRRHSLEGGVMFVFAVILISGSFTNTMFAGAVSRALIMFFIGWQGLRPGAGRAPAAQAGAAA